MSNAFTQEEAIVKTLALYGERRPLTIADIGSQSAWLKSGSPHARNLYVSGPMGLASSIALGVATCRPDEDVLAVCGDGALAMNLSSLATIQGAGRVKLTLLVIANGVYDYTSALPSPTQTLDWRELGRAVFGADAAHRLEDLTPDLWRKVPRPAFIVATCAPTTRPAPALGLTPNDIRASFLAATRAP